MKNPLHSSLIHRFRRPGDQGFALVITLSLLVLLTVIAVGLLSLSTISLRASTQTSDMATARSNARMALMLAIGELQKTAGRDTRVTANADLLDETNPPVLGVWKSWEGIDHDNSGRPIAPNYSNHKSTRFVAWLTSAPDNSNMASPPDTRPGAIGKVTLLGKGSVGTANANKRQVHLDPTPLVSGKTRGNFAWWIGGENQKARLPRPYAPGTSNSATWSVLAKSHSTIDTAPFGLDDLLTDSSLNKPELSAPGSRAVSLKGADLLVAGTRTEKISTEFFHDLSATSVGLLTNTATGGWRKDLSLMAENWNNIGDTKLPFFRVTPTKDLQYTRPTTDALSENSLLYPWSDYRRGATDNRAIYSFPAIGSWANLVDYATLYKNKMGAAGANGSMTMSARATTINGDVGEFIHKVRVMPLIARIQWVFSHKTKYVDSKYDLYLVAQPLITLWNPYNVRLETPGSFTFTLGGPLPPQIQYKVGSTMLPVGAPKKIAIQSDKLQPKGDVQGALNGTARYRIDAISTFGPGETKVFSSNTSVVPGENPSNPNPEIILVPGWFLDKGPEYLIQKGLSGGSNQISTIVSYDCEMIDDVAGIMATGVGMSMDMHWSNAPGSPVLAYRMLYKMAAAKAFYPKPAADEFPTPSLEEAKSTSPFLSITFGARMASHTLLPSKGFVQSSPFVNYTAMGEKSTLERTIQYPYPGALHNVNSPFEYSFSGTDAGPENLPERSGISGFIVTGFGSANGLSRCVISELPGRPLASLAELQNWDARFENPVPPYAFNLVGNSEATPLIPAREVVNTSKAKGKENLQHDDSFCLNHVLFDDWFVSSIASEPTGYGMPSSPVRTTYANFLKNTDKPLANRAYKPLAADTSYVNSNTQNATTAYADHLGDPTTGWKTIASRIEVEGMFNVNSTSKVAWRALLGHARNQKIPYISATGNPTLSSETDYAVSRFSVAGDVESSKNGISGGFAGDAEYTGYRVFTEAQLDTLADEIVNQVRLRGPFLSLSEFVNRQLSSGEPALAGALQTALNKLAAGPDNPFGVLRSPMTGKFSNVALKSPKGTSADSPTGYSFAQAAEGFRCYGVPGWTRQADILRPLAPILSARDDTFVIRAYGDARDASGNVVKARAVCEATVRRSRNFVNPANDAAFTGLSEGSGGVILKTPENELFGRRFEVVSFRWLAAEDI